MVKGWTLSLYPRRLFLMLLIALTAIDSAAAQSTYYVQLTDKKNSPYSIDRPEAFLSPKAIERRHLQGIAIQQDDLPVSALYLRQIDADCHILYALKWSNAVVVRSDDPAIVSRLKSHPFVSDVRLISSNGPSTVHKALDYNNAARQDQILIDTTFYGTATRQSMMIHIDALHAHGYWGDGVIIAMMDAGFLNADTNPYMHKTFEAGRVLYTWDFVFGDSDVYRSPNADTHGAETFSCIASDKPYIMVGTAPNADFLLFHTEDTRSETIVEEYNWAAAAEVADSLGAEVFSTSLGYTTFDASDSVDDQTYAGMNGHTTPIAKAVNKAAAKGIIVVNSAGNEGASSWHYIATPGDADSGLTVGAVQPSAVIAAFSSRGPNSSGQVKPDVCAQGSPAALVSPYGELQNNSGTSFSCPITAGAVACLRQAFPSAPGMTILHAVQRSSSIYTMPNGDYGYGIPDFGLAYDILKGLYPSDTIPYVTYTEVFPNPFTTSLKVVVTDLLQDSVSTAELFDLNGQKVWSYSASLITYTHNIWELTPPADLAQGVYILRINKTKRYRLVRR